MSLLRTALTAAILTLAASTTATAATDALGQPQPDSLTADEAAAMDFLNASMPLSDRLMYSQEYFLGNVRASLAARREMPWGASVPDNLFRHFVLPVRSNNEYLDDFRTTYYAELAERVRGLSMRDAALEVNHWLHEKVSYEPSDARTSAPMATIRTAKGRCGEESVLGVAAMRAVCIPARQVYTPRWAHTDDNHAWVEVWVDGRWHFLGACEPEPELDRAWFNSPVSRGMLMHTRVFGRYQGAEPTLSLAGNITEINVTANYVPVQTTTVRVLDPEGRPAAGVAVEFKLYNYAEFYTVARSATDGGGHASLVSGCGDLLAWATDGAHFGFVKVNGDTTDLRLCHPIGERISVDIDIVPPDERPLPSHATEEQVQANNRRMAAEDSIRAAYMATFYRAASQPGRDPREADLLTRSRGNWREIDKVLAEAPADRREEAVAMLQAVSHKDLRDTPASIFLQTLAATPPGGDNPLYANYILNPHISNELLSAYRADIPRQGLTVDQIKAFVANEITVDDGNNGYRVPIVPTSAWRSRVCDSHSRDILFVALCRNEGIAARIDEVTGKVQWHDGTAWLDVSFNAAPATPAAPATAPRRPKGRLIADYTAASHRANPQYYRHFTISNLSTGAPSLLEFDEAATYETTLKEGVSLDAGYYLLVTGSRMADGSVMAHMECVAVDADATARCQFLMRQNEQKVSVIGSMDCEAHYLPGGGAEATTSLLATTGRGYFAIAVLGDGDEPSNHAVEELRTLAPALNQWQRPLLVLKPGGARRSELDPIANLHYGSDPDSSIAAMLRTATESAKTELPVIAIADSFGRIVFISEGYDTSLAAKMKHVIDNL